MWETTVEKIIARLAEIEGQRYFGNNTPATGGILCIGPRWTNEFKKDNMPSETTLNISFELGELEMGPKPELLLFISRTLEGGWTVTEA